MRSSLYYDVDDTIDVYKTFIERLKEYSIDNKMEIFMIKIPKSDLSVNTYEQQGCFMLMSPGYQVALVNAFSCKGDFEDYQEDVDEVIGYLFSKYEYRTELGRYKDWKKPLLTSIEQWNNQCDLDVFWDEIKLDDPKLSKNVNLLISLCTGSINEISRVRADVPDNVLDKVKQKIQLFDADQTWFIYKEIEKKIVRIQGLSGTGKTELLLHKLKELYQKQEKYKIFVTCHNKILADSLRKRIPDFFNYLKVSQQIEWGVRLWCAHAWGSLNSKDSGLYAYICYFYNIPFSSYNYYTNFESVCRSAINEIKKKKQEDGEDFKYALDYVLVDECQDFKESFFKLCELVTRHQIFVAGDIFQSIFSEQNTKDYEADTFLSRCYRTDSRTLMFAHALGLGLFESVRYRWLEKADWEACGYTYQETDDSVILARDSVRQYMGVEEDYDSMVLVPVTDRKDIIEQLLIKISDIQKDYPNATVNDFCVILLDLNESTYSMANVIEAVVAERFNWTVNKAYETKMRLPDSLLISNRNNVKGLEYPFVFCISNGLSDSYTYRNSVYTMMTRSFLQTYLLIPQGGEFGLNESIMNGYKEIMQHHKMTIKKATKAEIDQIGTRFKEAKSNRTVADILMPIIHSFNLSTESELKMLKLATIAIDDVRNMSDEELHYRLRKLKDAL